MSSFETNSTRDASKECPYDPLDNVTSIYSGKNWARWGQNLFVSLFTDFFFRFREGGEGVESSENNQVTGHFLNFRAFFFNISRKNSKTSKVNQQSVLNH